jgi:hypothetical protein
MRNLPGSFHPADSHPQGKRMLNASNPVGNAKSVFFILPTRLETPNQFFYTPNPVGNAKSVFFILPTQLEMPNQFFSSFQPGWKRQISFFHPSNPVGSIKP